MMDPGQETFVGKPSRTGDADHGARPDRAATPASPRWVKVFGALLAILVLLLLIVLIIGGGPHGPGRHLGADVTPVGLGAQIADTNDLARTWASTDLPVAVTGR